MRHSADTSTLGVALTKCFFCGDGDRIVLNTRLTSLDASRVESMHGKVIDMQPCQKCAQYMRDGIILIGIDEAKSGEGWNTPPRGEEREGWMPNPYRTGQFCVVRESWLDNIDGGDPASPVRLWAQKHRWMFVDGRLLPDHDVPAQKDDVVQED